MLFRLILLFFTLGGLFGAWDKYRSYQSNRTPAPIPVETFQSGPPKPVWVTVTGCAVDLRAASVLQRDGKILRVFAPLRRPTDLGGELVLVLMSTTDRAVIQLLEKLRAMTAADRNDYLDRHPDELFVKREVVGMLRAGDELDDATMRNLRALDRNVGKGSVLVYEGEKPSLRQAVIFSAVVLASLIAFAFTLRRKPSMDETAVTT